MDQEEDIALRRDGWERDASQASIWKEQLREMMAQTLLPKGFSPSFPTSDNLHVALGLTRQDRKRESPSAIEMVSKKKKKNR